MEYSSYGIFRQIAALNPDKTVFHAVEQHGTCITCTNTALFSNVKRLAARLEHYDMTKPVLLLYTGSIDFVVAFLACQAVGAIAVPMFYPRTQRHFMRLQHIINDCSAGLILCEASNLAVIREGLAALHIPEERIAGTDWSDENMDSAAFAAATGDNNISFIQYTSGSTGLPKGVVVTQENIVSNLQQIQETFSCDQDTVVLSWLPFYHDMGLIGNLLQCLYTGCTCVLVSPVAVVQRPESWLQLISQYKVTHSGGPNFMYDLCIEKVDADRLLEEGVDLRTWKIAYNGAEPVKKRTLDAFAEKFAKLAFNPDALFPCYGLAEATLLVAAGTYRPTAGSLVSSGKICRTFEVALLNTETGEVAEEEGEIVIHGPSVTSGYLGRDNDSLFCNINGKQFLRTGDIGRIQAGELYITGRQKEMIIINGKNYFPYDLEHEIAAAVEALSFNNVIVSYLADITELPLVFAEIGRHTNPEEAAVILQQIDSVVIAVTNISCIDIVLLGPRSMPRTSSGKLQRIRCRKDYLEGALEKVIATKRDIPIPVDALANLAITINPDNLEKIADFLRLLINQTLKLELKTSDFNENTELIALGIDSLKGVEMVNLINHYLQLNMEATRLLSFRYVKDLEEFIANLIWLRNVESAGEKITI
ncbi:AMP-binding protein [Chitinophaga nivalis]|uniref:AMP-binding protein n=1 Tax=Chitinophaga nivalis TaxID=2991709 RepID=A0ABT3IK86_9BACT|nr:AMP-binding protein [Chitinophaga nivalis]MCW3465928.1 AMP-binding protein [Chitinophaga nivalis]MCW3484381.1 AMP-binding protein [Chitinophaga nivalis]